MAKLSLEQTLLKAKSLVKQGKRGEAGQLYRSVLEAFPNNKRAQQGLARLNKPEKSKVQQEPPQNVLDQLSMLNKQKCFKATITQAATLALSYPNSFMIWNIIGAAHLGLGQFAKASHAFEKVTRLNPSLAEGFYKFGLALQQQGKVEQAISCYTRALQLNRNFVDAYNNMGAVFHQKGDFDKALDFFFKALSLKPDHAQAHNNMGNAFFRKKEFYKAITCYMSALNSNTEYASPYKGIGDVMQAQGRFEDAVKFYTKASSLKLVNAELYHNLGVALQVQGKLDDAISAFNEALSIQPDLAESYSKLADTLTDQGKIEEAIEAYSKALSLKPDFPGARSKKMHQQAHICDWLGLKENQTYLSDLGVSDDASPPFGLLSLEDNPARHRLRSENWIKTEVPVKVLAMPSRPLQRRKRLRVGYFSADFHNHATMYLIAQVFAEHDKEQFEIFSYSYGPEAQDDMREKLICSVDHFRNVREMGDLQIVELARQDELDIAVDLKGFTKRGRLAPFAYGLAPVQISYLGYPGTLGASFIDYIVADPIVIPKDKRQHYSEQIIYLPHTYQPTDNHRVISKKVITRKDMGIPKNGFVFCCFNNNYKISSREFDIWMRLLQKVEGSVLWLLKKNKWAEHNLKREAEARGVNAERLIFAEKLPQAEHLARQKLADLFLDTFNYNAHTTTSDALWAGLPVLTKLGEGFAARVAGSLLHAVGLPELVTEKEDQYEALALELAMNPKRLAQIKAKLAKNRLTQPLFDTEQYTRHLESAYQMAYEQYLTGNGPEHIFVKKIVTPKHPPRYRGA